MKLVCLGGGPAGLYTAILLKRANPAHEVEVIERNRPDDTFGFGVVFSDATLDHLTLHDPTVYEAIRASLAHWDDIETHVRGQVLTSTGHGFAGLSRQRLLAILQARAAALGVTVRFEHEAGELERWLDADLVVAADGVNSAVRSRFADRFGASVDLRPNRFVWLGTTYPFDAFTFYFDENEHGLFRVHAYRYEPERSTFIVECREDTWRRAGLDRASEAETLAYCERLFAPRLAGHRLLANKSLWRQFPTVHCDRWSIELESARGTTPVVLLGDAAHTAHFSIGSGTKLALEDAIELVQQLDRHPTPREALAAYDALRRPVVLATQRAAEVSLEWFENTERYLDLPPVQFGFSLLTRSLRITHENLRLRDARYVTEVDAWVASEAGRQVGAEVSPRPPMFTPYRLGRLELDNRIVVSPMCQYSAESGTVDDWHLVHLGSRALGGAALVIAEMTDVSADGRITPGCAGLYDGAHVTAWRRITDFVHRHSRAKIGIQLGHAGRKGSTEVPWRGGSGLTQGSWPLLAASAVAYAPGFDTPREMDRADMDRVKAEFVNAARLADEADFDLCELHAAHGYLLASFISPLTNRRRDEYGGDVEGRLRFPLEVMDAVRAAWPRNKPMSVRVSATDWAEGGLDLADLLVVARRFHEHGADILDVSAGQTDPASKPVYGRLYQTPFSEFVRLEAGVPTMTVGNVQSWSDVNTIIAAGRADLCVLARAHLFDPYWTRHAASDQGWQMDWPDQYATVRRYTPRFR